MKKNIEFLLLILTVFILASCVSTKVKQVAIRETIDIQTGVDAKPLLFKKVVVKLPRGKRIGSIQGGVFCIPQGRPLTWKQPFPFWRLRPKREEVQRARREVIAPE